MIVPSRVLMFIIASGHIAYLDIEIVAAAVSMGVGGCKM